MIFSGVYEQLLLKEALTVVLVRQRLNEFGTITTCEGDRNAKSNSP